MIINFSVILNTFERESQLSDLKKCFKSIFNQSYKDFINDHPFINVNRKSLESKLRDLIKDPDNILFRGSEGKTWVNRHHSIGKVADELYRYYLSIGLKT